MQIQVLGRDSLRGDHKVLLRQMWISTTTNTTVPPSWRSCWSEVQRRGALNEYKRFGNDFYEREEEYKLKMDFPSFNGQIHVEAFIDWLSEVERVFDYMNIKESRKVKLVALRLKSGAAVWWDQTTLKRNRFQKKTVRIWSKMKQLLWERFLLVDYEYILYTKY